MKSSFKVVIAVGLLLIINSSYAQEYKTLATINNAFVDRKDEWKEAKKMDFGIKNSPKGVSVSFSSDGLSVNNVKNDKRLWIENATTKSYEQECWKYVNGMLTLNIKQVSGDVEKYSGLQIMRRLDISTVRSNWGKTKNGKMDYRDRSFTFLLNGKGDAKIIAGREVDEETELFTAAALKDFVAGGVNKVSIEKKTLTWNFYLNDKQVFTYNDNSYGGFSAINFAAAPGNKINFESFSCMYYDNKYAPYERVTEGITTYNDNESGFKIMEDNIDKMCPTAEFNNGTVRYASVYCEKQKKDYSYFILFFKNGQKSENPLSNFLDTYLKDLYGAEYNAETFKSKKAVTEKANEVKLVEEIKTSFTSMNKKATNIQFTEVKDLTVGDMGGRSFDVNYELNGEKRVERKFYAYLPKGLLLVQFDAQQNELDTNPEYKSTAKSIFTL